MKQNRRMGTLLIVSIILIALLAPPGTAEAARAGAVKSVSLKIGGRKVAKKTYPITKGETVSLKVTVNPLKARTAVSFKSSNKKIAAVNRKGKITAKKTGTVKITATVRAGNGKKKTAYVKIKVTARKSKIPVKNNGHTHKWERITRTDRIWIVDREAYDEGVYVDRYVCRRCGHMEEEERKIIEHIAEPGVKCSAYTWTDVKVGTIHHKEEGHYENQTVTLDRRCVICGILDSQL